MKKILIILFTFSHILSFGQLLQSGNSFLMSGNNFISTTASVPVIPPSGQIIADHNAVAAFDNIPQYWIDEVKKMQLGYVGESHSEAVRIGLQIVEDGSAVHAVNIGQTPQAYTDQYLRVHAAFYSNGSWTGLGEYEWYKNANAITTITSGITYINTTVGNPMDVFGLGWCWDPAETASEMATYVEATKAYINHCVTNSYQTNVIFTTGPVDEGNASGETGWNKYLAYEVIRDSVANDPSRILFDFADILCYDSGNPNPTTATWNGNTYPVITATNYGTGSVAHMSNTAAERLGRAMWWMLARIAGWDGTIN